MFFLGDFFRICSHGKSPFKPPGWKNTHLLFPGIEQAIPRNSYDNGTSTMNEMYIMYFLLNMRIFRPVMLVFRGVASKTLLFPICLRPFTSKNGHLPLMVGVQINALPETNSGFTPESQWLVADAMSFWGPAYFQGLCLLVFKGSVHFSSQHCWRLKVTRF